MSIRFSWYVLLLFFHVQDQLYAVDDTRPIVIGIGHTCATALMIKYFGLRYKSYPFDWLITDLNGIISAINSDFSHMVDKHYLKNIDECHTTTIDAVPGRMWHTLYNFFFIHDFTVRLNNPQIETQLVGVRDRFTRRINRLMHVIGSGTKVILIRWNNCADAGRGVTKETYVKLRDLLARKHPSSNITIITVDQRTEYAQKWGLDRIKNYYMPYHKTSSDAHHLWVPILREHNLIQ